MMEIHHMGLPPVTGNHTFPTTSTGEVGKVWKQAFNQHPHHHPSRGCGGVVGEKEERKTEVGKAEPLLGKGTAAMRAEETALPVIENNGPECALPDWPKPPRSARLQMQAECRRQANEPAGAKNPA